LYTPSNISILSKHITSKIRVRINLSRFVWMQDDEKRKVRKVISSLNLSELEGILKSKYEYTLGRSLLTPIGMFLPFAIIFLRMEFYPRHF